VPEKLAEGRVRKGKNAAPINWGDGGWRQKRGAEGSHQPKET